MRQCLMPVCRLSFSENFVWCFPNALLTFLKNITIFWHKLLSFERVFLLSTASPPRYRSRCWAAIRLSHRPEPSGRVVRGEVDGLDIGGQHGRRFVLLRHTHMPQRPYPICTGRSGNVRHRCGAGLRSQKSRHPTPTPGNFDYPTPTPTPTPDRLRPSAVLVT